MFPIIILIVFNETQKYKGINTWLGHIDPLAYGVSAALKHQTNSFSEGKLDFVQ